MLQTPFIPPAVVIQRSTDGSAYYRFHDGSYDAVRFPTNDQGPSVCVSVQKGCSLGARTEGVPNPNACRFCSTGRYHPFGGSLTADEIAHEAHVALEDTPELDRAEQIRIFFAGMGDSIFNAAHVVGAMSLIQRARPDHRVHFAIATIGTPVALMQRLGKRLDAAFLEGGLELGTQVYFQLSMHGATDEKRSHVIPMARRNDIAEVIREMIALRDRLARYMGAVVSNPKYPDRYLLTLNYLMLGSHDAGFAGNAEDADVRALIGILRMFGPENFVVRLSQYNPDRRDGEHSFSVVAPEVFDHWENEIRREAPEAVVKQFRSKARDVRAGCGQMGQAAPHGCDPAAED